jgi:hypothetical protein
MRAKRQQQRETGQEAASSAITNRPPRGEEEYLRPGEILVEDRFGKLVGLDQRETEVPPATADPERFDPATEELLNTLKMFSDAKGEAFEKLRPSDKALFAAFAEEAEKIYNRLHMDDAAKACMPAADYYGLPVERVQQTLEALRATERETTTRATVQPRQAQPAAKVSATVEPRPEAAATETTTPKASNGLEWPTEKWKGSPEELSRKRYQIIVFLRRVWKPFIENNNVIVTREILKERDADAASALRGYLQYHEFPKDIRILTSDQLRQHLTKQPISANALPALHA